MFLNSYYLSFKNINMAFILTAFSLFFILPFTEERPQLFTMLFFSFFIYFYLNKLNNLNVFSFILLLFLSLIWVNIHYTIIAAIYILLIVIVFSGKKIIGLLPQVFLIVSIIIISVFNPDGIMIFNFFSKDIWVKQYIREWQGLFQYSNIYFFIYQVIYFLIGIFIVVFFIKVYKISDRLKILNCFLLSCRFLFLEFYQKK